MVGLECKLGCDLLEGILGIRKSKLVAEECGFGGSSVRGRGRGDGVERGFNVLLGLLHQVRDVEHGFGPAAGQKKGSWLFRVRIQCLCFIARQKVPSLVGSRRAPELMQGWN